jgi:serine/threonine protein kinase
MIGQTLSHFQILEKVGEGGMGVVYKAVDLNLKRSVALKLLPPEVTNDPGRRKRFVQEAQSASALNHPHIVTIHEIGSAGEVDFIAMEYVEGNPLQKVIGKTGLELGSALKYAIQIADALSVAHKNGIIHRDLKPQNIMITGTDQVKVLDFGLAKLIQPAESSSPEGKPEMSTLSYSQTQPGVILGTPHYMSPEQAEGKPLDPRSDIFSFGIILYEMVAGRRPFGGESSAAILSSILRDRPQSLQSVRSGVPDEIVRMIDKALEKDPQYRYQHMEDILSDLRKLQRDLTSGESTVHTKAVGGRPLSRRILPFAIGFSVLLLVLLGTMLLHRREETGGNLAPSGLQLISTFPGSHRSPSFSPDGSMIAFVDEVAGVPRIRVKNLMRGDPIEITTGEKPADRPQWSPKNDQILFWSGSFEVSHKNEAIWSVPPLGGVPSKLIDAGRNPSFSRDGNEVVFERGNAIWVAGVDGSHQRKVEGVRKVSLQLADRFPAFSPDGTLITYFQAESGPDGDYWIVPSSGGEARRLTFDDALGGAPVWTPDGRFILFSSKRAGSTTLWKVALSGSAPQPLTTGAGEDTDPAISPDGKRLLFTNTRNAKALKLMDPRSGANRELMVSRENIVAPVFSPDGTRIAFFSDRGKDSHLFTIHPDGTGLTQVTSLNGETNIFPRWSPDGSYLYFYQMTPEASFRKIPANGGQSSVVVRGWVWESAYGAQIDPTEKFVVYVKRSQGGIEACVIRDLKNGTERALPVALDDPRWSKNGKWIAGYDAPENADSNVIVCPADGGACRTLTRGINPVWSGDDSHIFFQRKAYSDDGADLWSVSLDGIGEKKIGELRPMVDIAYYYDVSAQDQIAWVQFNRSDHELWLLNLSPE